MPEGTKKVKDIIISKMFTILNLLTFDRAKSRYMENGDLCSGAWTDPHLKQISSPSRTRPSNHPGAFGHVKDAQTDTNGDVRALNAAMVA